MAMAKEVISASSESAERKRAAIAALDKARAQEVLKADKLDRAVGSRVEADSRAAQQRTRKLAGSGFTRRTAESGTQTLTLSPRWVRFPLILQVG